MQVKLANFHSKLEVGTYIFIIDSVEIFSLIQIPMVWAHKDKVLIMF